MKWPPQDARLVTVLATILFAANRLPAQAGWWSTEPIRWVQTNLREVDAAMDTGRLATQLAEMRANVVLMGMGGITAYYPTRVEFHYASPYLAAGRDFEVNGTLDQEDRQAYETAKPIFQWAAANQQHYAGLRNVGRVLLLAGPSSRGAADHGAYRGMFRLLTEEHIPFAVSENMEWLGKRVFDLVIATDWAPRGLQQYVEQGGRLLIASSHPPEFAIARVIATTPDVKGYLRVRNHTLFPSLADTDLLMLNGPFTALDGDGRLSLSLVPPSMIGPPEKVHVDIQDTTTPGMVTKSLGQGTVVWLPWELGALYYRHSLLAHAGLFRDVVAKLYPERQLKTNAHPLVAVTLMEQGGRTQLHFINFSGHSQTAWFAPVPMREIRVELLGAFHSARAVRHPMELKIVARGGYSEIVLPELLDYELVVLN